jgi:hypothetical protein
MSTIASVWSPSSARVPLDVAVVEVVEDGRREHAVEADHACLLVELVLVAAARGISTTTSTSSGKRSAIGLKAAARYGSRLG